MNNLKTNLYVWILMLLGLNMARTAAQTPVDTAYERTMLRLAVTKNIVIDTVEITGPQKSYQWGYYDAAPDKIHITHFAENYNETLSRDIIVLKAKNHIQYTLAHEQTHRRNNELFQHTIFKNMLEYVQYRMYDEISARLAAIIKFREQMAKNYREQGRLVITNLLGYEFENVPMELRKQIPRKKLYRSNFDIDPTSNYYQIYMTYLVNNPDVLMGPAHGIEMDYMLMTALNEMNKNFKQYISKFADPNAKKPMYVNFKFLTQMHDKVFKELIPNTNTPVCQTPFAEFAPEWRAMGFDPDAPTPTPEQIRRAARVAAAKFESGEIRAIMFDELIQKMFIFDGIDYITDCTPAANIAIQKHINQYTNIIINEWTRDIETLKISNSFIEAYWADYHKQPRAFTSPLIHMIQNQKRR